MTFLDLEKSALLLRSHERIKLLHDRIKEVHQRQLHAGQIRVAKAFFAENKKIIMSQWSRSGGKTEGNIYIAWRYALLNDNALIYIIAPELKHGRKIYWTPRRLQDYGPQEYVAEHRDSDLATVLKNRSKIIIDGAENYQSLRGIKPHLVFYDEFQDHKKEFDLEVMRPNLLAKNSALIVTGTPPKQRDRYYVEFREQLISQILSGDSSRAYFEIDAYQIPHFDKLELDRIKQSLFKAGNHLIWEREYMAKMVFGGADSVFPPFNRKQHIKSHDFIASLVVRDFKQLKFFIVADPGSSSCFAILFGAYNPYTSQVILFDEIYQKDRRLTDAKSIKQQIDFVLKNLFSTDVGPNWRRIYDEAAAWFEREMVSNFRQSWTPTQKFKRDKDDRISTLKLLMSEENALLISDRCKWLAWEIESYVTDELGRYPDKNDHLINCFEYLTGAANVQFIQKAEKEESSLRTSKPTVLKDNRMKDWEDNALEEFGGIYDRNDYLA